MKKTKKVWNEIFIIISVVDLFMLTACIDKIELADQKVFIYAGTFMAATMCMVYWGQHSLRIFASWRKNRWKIDIGACFVFFFSILCRMPQLADHPRWDAWSYYKMFMKACENFNFTFAQFVREFSLAGHPTLGYAGVLAIGEFLFPGQYFGIILVNLILAAITYWCLYKILQKVLPNAGTCYWVLAVCTASVLPLTLGTFSYFQPDMGIVYFFIMTLYCFLYKKQILMLFSLCLLALSKEIGCLAAAGFILGIFIYTMGRKKGGGLMRRVLIFLKQPLGYISLIGGAGFILYLFLFRSVGGQNWSYQAGEFENFATFRFQPEFILYKWKQFLLLNFNWIIWSTILVCLILMIRKKRWKDLKRKAAIFSVISVWIIQVLFYCSYINFVLPRYHVLIDASIVIIMLFFLGTWGRSRKVRIYLIIIGGLFLIQSYYTIDPVTKIAFRTKENIVIENYKDGENQRDYTVYNHQFNYLSQVYEEVLRAIDYDGTQDVLNWEAVAQSEIGENGLLWDMKERKYAYKTNENTIPVRVLNKDVLEQGGIENVTRQKEAVYIHTPQFNVTTEDAEEYIQKNYSIRYKGEVSSIWGGKISFYVCDLIEKTK